MIEKRRKNILKGKISEFLRFYFFGLGQIQRLGEPAGSDLPYLPFGWVYGIADFSSLIITGESIMDRVGDFVDKHWV